MIREGIVISKQSFIKPNNGFYELSPYLSGIDTAKQIREIISIEGKLPIKFRIFAKSGHLDFVLGYCVSQYGIDLDYEEIQNTQEFVLTYKG